MSLKVSTSVTCDNSLCGGVIACLYVYMYLRILCTGICTYTSVSVIHDTVNLSIPTFCLQTYYPLNLLRYAEGQEIKENGQGSAERPHKWGIPWRRVIIKPQNYQGRTGVCVVVAPRHGCRCSVEVHKC